MSKANRASDSSPPPPFEQRLKDVRSLLDDARLSIDATEKTIGGDPNKAAWHTLNALNALHDALTELCDAVEADRDV